MGMRADMTRTELRSQLALAKVVRTDGNSRDLSIRTRAPVLQRLRTNTIMAELCNQLAPIEAVRFQRMPMC